MTNERYWQLCKDDNEKLTNTELSEGWHFCREWDYLLIGPGMSEIEVCCCILPKKKQV